MDDSIDALIKDISLKHGVEINRDDPILISQTINEKFIADTTKMQQEMLHQYKEELEGITLRWDEETKKQSERILNASLSASKETIEKLLQDSVKNTVSNIKREVDESLSRASKVLRSSEKVAMINLCSSAITFLAACAIVISLLFR
jgi:hypothetical protein